MAKGKPKGGKGNESQGSSDGAGGIVRAATVAILVAAIGVYMCALDSVGVGGQDAISGFEVPVVTPEIRGKMAIVQAKEAKITRKAESFWLNHQDSEGAIVVCPAPDPQFKSNPGTKKMNLKIFNPSNVQFALYWVDAKGGEVEMAPIGTIGPAKPYGLQTFDGHGWRARDDDGDILFETLTKFNSGGADPGEFEIKVTPCTPTEKLAAAEDAEEIAFEMPTFDATVACEDLPEWLSVVPSTGYHPLCLKGSIFEDGNLWNVGVEISAFVGGYQKAVERGSQFSMASGRSSAMMLFRKYLETIVSMPAKHTDAGRKPDKNGYMPQHWQLVSHSGVLAIFSATLNISCSLAVPVVLRYAPFHLLRTGPHTAALSHFPPLVIRSHSLTSRAI
jgi:hypothetical protein